MNTARERMVSKHSYIKRQLKGMRPGLGMTASLGNAATETSRFASDLSRQVFLFGGLFLLVAIIIQATMGNTFFSDLVSRTGWFNN